MSCACNRSRSGCETTRLCSSGTSPASRPDATSASMRRSSATSLSSSRRPAASRQNGWSARSPRAGPRHRSSPSRRSRAASEDRACLECLASELEEPFERPEVELVSGNLDGIARSPCEDDVPAKLLPKSRDVVLENTGGSLRRLVAPQLVDEHVRRRHLARARQQDRQHGALPRPSELNRPVQLADLERAEDPKLHRSMNVPGCSPRFQRGSTTLPARHSTLVACAV